MRPGSFELVAACDFGELDDARVPMTDRDMRVPPTLVRGGDGAVWLFDGEVGGVIEGGEFRGRCGGASSLAPLAGGGVVALDRDLIRFDANGDEVWRQRALPFRVESLALDGEVFLLGAGVARVALEDGAITVVAHEPGPWLVGCGWRMQIAGGRVRRRARIGGGFGEVTPAPELLKARALAPLPDGGALWVQQHQPIWMAPDGRVRAKLPLAGVARDGEMLWVAESAPGALELRAWRGGQLADERRLPVEERARLHSRGCVWLPSEQRCVDFAGEPMTPADPAGSALDTAHPVIEPDGAALFAGADADGVFLLRARP
jgi:hypothetical protein